MSAIPIKEFDMFFRKLVFPFFQSIELRKPVKMACTHYHWKAEIEDSTLTIRTWLGDDRGTPFRGCAVKTIANHECQDNNPVHEMWRRALDKIERQDFIIVNGY